MLWAEWTSFGLDDRLFWESTADEVVAVLEKAQERFDRFDQLAGMIAAEVHNMAGRAAKRAKQWKDYFQSRPSSSPRLSEEEQERFEARPLMRVTSESSFGRRLST